MFEAQVAGLLERYLGKYVSGLDASSLRISVWKGDVELRNLHLRPEALEELNLPVTVKSGLVGRLTLKVPWSNLGNEPVVAEFDRLYVVACPKPDDSRKGACTSSDADADAAAAAEAAEITAKRERVHEAEEAWLKDMIAKETLAAGPTAAQASADAKGWGAGRIGALVNTIIGNLQLKITNLHIRYEDPSSNPGHSFCIGVMLQEISAVTTDEQWQSTFVTTDAMLVLRKLAKLKKLCIYFDCDVPLFGDHLTHQRVTQDVAHVPDRAAKDRTIQERWDKLMLPANHAGSRLPQPESTAAGLQQLLAPSPRQQPQQHQFLLCPVDGELRYVRRGKAARELETDAEQEMQLILQDIGVRLHQLQYQSGQKLLQEFDSYAAGAPHRHLRPQCRPKAGHGARRWWHYAIEVVKRQNQTFATRGWNQLTMVARDHKQYVPQYLRYLQLKQQQAQAPRNQQGKDEESKKVYQELADIDRQLAAMDQRLDEPVILLFRRMAHAKFNTAKKKAAAAAAAKQQSQQGWIGWLMGTGKGHQQQTAAAAVSTVGDAVDISMGPEEWNRLEQLVADQEAALGDDKQRDTPNAVKSIICVEVKKMAAELQDNAGKLLMQAALEVVDSRVIMYPQTKGINFSVSKFGITSSHGPLMSSGCVVPTQEVSDAVTAAASRAMLLGVVLNPQDGSTDLAVDLAVAPSYVTYDNAALQDVANFFKSEESLELSRLQAQAAARTDKLRHMAQLQLRALSQRSMESKPRMRLKMTLHAPKVAVQDASGSTTLIADLGCFIIKSNPQAARNMSAEEAAVYEPFVVKVDHVAAYFLDGPFAWPSTEDLAAATAAAAELNPSAGAAEQLQQAHTISVLQALLARRARVVSLLDRFGVGMDLHVATNVHPRYPVIRLAVSASPLKLHLSPYRYQQLMLVVQSVAPSRPPAEDAAAAAGAASNAPDKPLWLSEAEHTSKVSLLTWEGMSGSVAKWQSHRYVHVWRGRLYITPHREDAEVCLSRTYWMGYNVVMVPNKLIGGIDNVVAVLPKHVKVEAAAESPEAVVLRASDAAAAVELRKRLLASANQMAAVAGLLELGDVDDQDAAIGTTKDVFDELFSHQLLLQLHGSISEVSLLVGGRAPVSWWPSTSGLDALPSTSSINSMLGTTASTSVSVTGDEAAAAPLYHAAPAGAVAEVPEPDAAAAAAARASFGGVAGHQQLQQMSSTGGTVAAATAALQTAASIAPGSSGDGNRGVLVPLEEEVDLVAIKFQGAQVGVTLGGEGFRTEVAMAALTMDDLLVGARNPGKAHMAESTVNWQQRQQEQQQEQQPVDDVVPPDAAAALQDVYSQHQQEIEAASPAPAPTTPKLTINTSTPAEQQQDPSTPAAEAATAPAGQLSSPEDDDDEFFDAEEGDPSTPQSVRKRRSSSSSSGPLPRPAFSSFSSAEGGAAVAGGTAGGLSSAAGAGSFLASHPLDSFRRAMAALQVDDATFIAAPSFAATVHNLNTAREGEELVRLLFAQYSPTSSNYTGLDVEVALNLSTLVFYCNRPTVAALMVFGTDLAAINTVLMSESPPEQEGIGAAPDAAGDSTTTDGESVSDIQLVRGGGEQRTLFKLTLQVSKVELHLNYEGDVSTPLAIGSIDNFLLELAVHPSTLQLHTSLGNLVADYCVLPAGHPNRTMVSMRDAEAGSLIDVVFRMHSLEDSFTENRVPAGMQYISVVTKLSTVQIVFMNRFLIEFLDYLAAMLAMQAKPKMMQQPHTAGDAPIADTTQTNEPQQAAKQQTAQQQTAEAAAQAAPAAEKPLIVLLDVHLDAPVLLMPMSTNSEDHIEVDLGTLQLSNRVVWEMRTEQDRQKLLLDEMQITLQKVSGCVVEGSVRGRNIIRDMGGGVQVSVRRALLADPLPLPPISTAVHVPKLRASVLDSEYALILAVLAGNFGETVDLPRSIAWLHQQLLAEKAVAAAVAPTPAAAAAPEPAVAAAATAAGTAAVAAAASNLTAMVSDSTGKRSSIKGSAEQAATSGPDDSDAQLKRRVVSDFTCTSSSLLGLLCDLTTVKTTVSIGQAQLMLYNKQPQGLPPAPVGSVEFSNLWVGVLLTQLGNMLMSLSLPSVCARDLRPGVPKEASLVLSTAEIGTSANANSSLAGTGAVALPVACPKEQACNQGATGSLLPSLLTLEYRMVKSIGDQPASALQVRLQRPTLVLDVGFIMKMLHFVAPTAGLQGPVPRPFETREVHLGPTPYLATDHLWLSPEYRIIADAPALKEAVYDGQGHALVLPDCVPAIEHVPLIVVGRGKTLRLKNVRIFNKQALAGVLLLGPGARLIAEETDGVSWPGREELMRLRNKVGRHIFSRTADHGGPATQQQQQPDAAAVGSMTISLHAVGAAVYLIDAHAAAEHPAMQDVPGSTAAGQTRPASAGGSRGSEGSEQHAEGSSRGDRTPVDSAQGSEGGGHAEMLQMLALYLDLGLDMHMEGANSEIVTKLRGLSVKAQTRLLEDAPAAAAAADAGADATSSVDSLDQPAAKMGCTVQQQVATSILEPCDVKFAMKTMEAVQDLNLDVSALQLRMSPDVMQLLLHLQHVVLEPLAVPPAGQPLTRVDRFGCIWCSHAPGEGSAIGTYATAGAGGVDILGSDKGVTVWRPQPPVGYAILGDVLTSGHSQPDHQVIAVAINSGLVTYPTGYTLVWETAGVSFWRPVPPPGYVAMGCIASLTAAGNGSSCSAGGAASKAQSSAAASAPVPPSRKACVVLAQQVAVEALLSECMLLCTNGNLWCIQNSCGTFEVAPPDFHQPQVPLYDVRSPLGIAPAALAPIPQPLPVSASAAQAAAASQQPGSDPLSVPVGVSPFGRLPPPHSLLAARAFAAQRASLRAKVAQSGQVTTTVEFSRIWWDKCAKHPSMTKVSFWRPLPPPGYVILGDCMVPGMYCPPRSVVVVRDTDPSEVVEGRPPLLARPIKCLQVWCDGHKRARGDANYLTLWRPIAPAGYVSMGVLASTGGREPPSYNQVRCVRADMASRVEFQASSPALIFYPYKTRPALGGWIADERSSTFVVVSHDGSPQLLEGFKLKDLEETHKQAAADDEEAGLAAVTSPRTLQMSVSVGKTNLLMRNLLRTPILELEAANINLGLSQEPCGVRRCWAYLTSSLWSYNQNLELWEPVMEPWQLLLHMDTNPNTSSSAGIAPGTWIRVTSPQGCLHVTLAQAALNYALDALSDWQGIAGGDTVAAAEAKSKRQGLAAADGLSVYTTILNTLDTAAYLQLDCGDGRKEVVVLQPHVVTPITQPMPMPAVSHAPLTASQPPPMRLVIDVLDCKLLEGFDNAGAASELSVKVKLLDNPKASNSIKAAFQELVNASQGMVTRSVAVQQNAAASTGVPPTAQPHSPVTTAQAVRWNQRFVLALPPELAEELLVPAPGDHPWEAAPVQLELEVWDGSGDQGLGRILSTARFSVTYTWLLSQVKALLTIRQAAAAATTSAVAATVDAGKRGFSNAGAAAAAAAAEQLGKTYTFNLKAGDDGGASTAATAHRGDSSSSGGGGAAPDDSSAVMQLTVAVSLDDSQVSDAWYPHQRMRGQLARAFSLSSKDGSRKLAAGSSTGKPGQLARTAASSAAGSNRHALRLEGSDMWSPFSYTSLRRLAGSLAGPHTGIVPIRAGQGLVLELSYTGGQYHARIRSLCQFFNSTDMTLEVALLEEDDSSWTMLPAAAGSTSGAAAAVGDVVEEEVFEYERYLPLRGWSADHLKGLDPFRYCRLRNGSKGSSTFPKVPLPQGWEWEGPWEVDTHAYVDPDGWAYAFEPGAFKWPPQPGAGNKKAHDFVRRRRLVRKRRRVALPTSVLDVSAAGQSTGSSTGASPSPPGEQWQRRVLGRVEPGGSLPLPQDWRSDNKQLQLRPMLLHKQDQVPSSPASTPMPSHAWSYGVSNGQHSVQLSSMEDSATRLLCCKTLGEPDQETKASSAGSASTLSPRKAAAAAPSCWFSTSCDASELVLQGGVDVLTDWSITAQPPLKLHNDLPVAAHYVLWERAARGGPLVPRQQGHIEGGATVNVYSVDMRQQVCLTFTPEGAEWARSEPVVVSEGYLGNTAGVDLGTSQLPDSFCVSYANSQGSNVRLRIALQRQLDTELLDSQRIRAVAVRAQAAGSSSGAAAAAAMAEASSDTWRMSHGAALAQGRPLVLSLSVPVWVINGTQLPISIGIVQHATAVGSDSSSNLVGTGDVPDSTSGTGPGLRVVNTEAYTQVTRPNSYVTIMGNSVELLSYPGEGPDGSALGSSGSGSSSQAGTLRALEQQAGFSSGVVQQWAAVVSVMGSRWSSPLVLTTASAAPGAATAALQEGDTAPVAQAVARLPRFEPVLIRAKCKDGCVYDITVRIEVAGSGLLMSTVVRLDPHIVVSNRTGYTLHMLQPEPIWKALGASIGSAMSTGMMPASSRSSSTPGAWFLGDSGGSAAAARRPPTAASSTPVKDATLVLRAGCLAVPLSWPLGCVKRLLLLTAPPHPSVHGAAAAVAAASESLEAVDPVMWSEPFGIEYPATGVMQVLLPLQRLGTPGEPQPVTEATMAAAYAAFNALFKPPPPPQQQQQQLRAVEDTTAAAAVAPAAGRPPPIPGLRISSSSSSKGGAEGEAAAAAHADNKPLLVHVARRLHGGLQEYLAVAVNLAVEMPAPGCMHVILQSLGGEAQQSLMNCTASAISYRQATPSASWQVLPPFSAAPLVLLQPPGSVGLGNSSAADPSALPSCAEVELRDADASTSGSAVCSLDTDSTGIAIVHGGKRSSSSTGGAHSGMETPATFQIASGKAQALAQVLPLMESVMAPAGPAEVPGAGSVSVGRTQTDRLVRVLPKPASVSVNQLRLAACIAGQDQARLSPASAMHLTVDIPSMDVSLVDTRPQELLLLTLDGLALEYHAGNSSGIAYTQMLMRLNLAQLDDMTYTTPFPVVLVPADKSVLEDTTADPLLFFMHVSQPSRFKGALYTPTIAGRIAALRLQLNETLIWRLRDFATSFTAGSGAATTSSTSSSRSTTTAAAGAAGNGGPAPSAGSSIGAGLGSRAASGSRARLAGGASSSNLAGSSAAVQPVGSAGNGSPSVGQGSSAVQQVASSDLPLQVDLLSLDDLPLRLSFRTDKASRPRWANQMVMFNTLGDMLNFEDLQLTLPGMQREGFREPRSALIGYGVKLLQREALAIMVNIFRSYGVLGTASRLLVVGSNITDKIATSFGGGPSAVASSNSASEQRVSNVAEGFLQGGKTFGMGLLKGVTGVVADPLAGAKTGGMSGFLSGVVRGAVGVPGQIVGGALVAASKVTEGLDASMRDAKEKLSGSAVRPSQRRRLPRCIHGDRVLTPFNLNSAMGLALLYSTDTGAADSMLKASFTGFVISSKKQHNEDVYETHVTLPAGCVAIITNMRLLMVAAEAFAALEADVLAGRVTQVASVPAGRLLWQLTWDQILSVELAYHRQMVNAAPDGILVHRKYRSDETEVLVHDVRCNPNNNQATCLYEAISAARQKYYLEPRREARGWKVTPVLAAEQQSDQEMPDVMLSMDFKRVWQSSKGARPLSVWRPVGPPGYASLGDVAMPGREPPHRPVMMYKDVAAQAGVLQDPVRGPMPALVMPERFQLMFRDSGGGNSAAVSIWRPIAPRGYIEVGHVVVSAIEEPPQNAVRVMRADLLQQARLYDYPVWSDASSDNVYWQCGIWQVDNPSCTFIAVKGNGKPNPRQAVSPKY